MATGKQPAGLILSSPHHSTEFELYQKIISAPPKPPRTRKKNNKQVILDSGKTVLKAVLNCGSDLD